MYHGALEGNTSGLVFLAAAACCMRCSAPLVFRKEWVATRDLGKGLALCRTAVVPCGPSSASAGGGALFGDRGSRRADTTARALSPEACGVGTGGGEQEHWVGSFRGFPSRQ